MLKQQKTKLIITAFLIISLLGLNGPWLFVAGDIEFRNGWGQQGGSVIMSFAIALCCLWITQQTKKEKILTFMSLLITPLYCIYLFFTWHIMTISGEIDLLFSFQTAHYGFYVTLFSSFIALIIYTWRFTSK